MPRESLDLAVTVCAPAAQAIDKLGDGVRCFVTHRGRQGKEIVERDSGVRVDGKVAKIQAVALRGPAIDKFQRARRAQAKFFSKPRYPICR